MDIQDLKFEIIKKTLLYKIYILHVLSRQRQRPRPNERRIPEAITSFPSLSKQRRAANWPPKLPKKFQEF